MHDGLKWSEVRRENERLARELAAAQARIAELETELADTDALVIKQGAMLVDTVNVLKGPPRPLSAHSTHDLVEWAARVRAVADAAVRLDAATPRAGEQYEALLAIVRAWRPFVDPGTQTTADLFAAPEPGR